MIKDLPVRLSVQDAKKAAKQLADFGKTGDAALRKLERGTGKTNKGLLAVDAGVKQVKGNVTSMAAQAGVAGAALTALGPAGIAAGAALAVTALAAKKMHDAVGPALEALAGVKDQADFAGTTAEAYQELSFAADQSSVSQDGLADGLKELNLRADEWIKTAKGPAEEAFRTLGYSQEELAKGLKNTDVLFVDIIRRMEDLDTASQIRVADEIFGGTAGEQFVRFMEKGADEIERMRLQARELGLVIDDEMIRKADESRDSLALMSKVIDVQLNTSLAHLGPTLVFITETFADMAKWVGEVVDGFVGIESKSFAGLNREISELEKRSLELGNDIEGHNGFQFTPLHVLKSDKKDVDAELFTLYQERNARLLDRDNRNPNSSGGGSKRVTPIAQDAIDGVHDDLNKKILQLTLAKNEYEKVAALATAGVAADSAAGQAIVDKIENIQRLRQEQAELNNYEKAYADLEKEVAATIDQATSAAENRNKTFADYIQSQEFSNEILQLTLEGRTEEVALLQAQADALARVGELTEEEAKAVANVAAERARLDLALKENQETTRETQNAARDLGLTFTSAFEDAVIAGEDFGDVMIGVLQDVAKMALRIGVTQPATNFLSDIFTSFFSFEKGGVMTSAGEVPLRKYAAGGIANSPQMALFGEGSKPEAYVPLPDGRNIPVNLNMDSLPRGGGDTYQITQNVTFQGQPGGEGKEKNDKMIAEFMKSLEDSMMDLVDRRIMYQNRLGGSLNPIRGLS